ncbi:MnuA family membrane nuclease [Mycoplasma simbae]|uniref:MnuA family membrane nuclease n=1 Tax=Mycoplasma simbae TaxID=36744 RepID=UPI000497EA8A|nr:hypothetical protein [Mycoplasma simbae]
MNKLKKFKSLGILLPLSAGLLTASCFNTSKKDDVDTKQNLDDLDSIDIALRVGSYFNPKKPNSEIFNYSKKSLDTLSLNIVDIFKDEDGNIKISYYISAQNGRKSKIKQILINKDQIMPEESTSGGGDAVKPNPPDVNSGDKAKEPEATDGTDQGSTQDPSQGNTDTNPPAEQPTPPNAEQPKNPDNDGNIPSNPKPPSEPTPLAKATVRLASWNVLNFSSKLFNESLPKAQAIVSIIYTQGYDVVGLTEVEDTGVAERLAQMLNELEKANKTNNVWKAISSPQYVPQGPYISVSEKHASFIYKQNIVAPMVLSDGKAGRLYDNSGYENRFGGAANVYQKAPFAVRFKVNIPGYQRVNFTYMVAHFDGPGVGKNSGEVSYNGGGSHEYNEAWNIKNVFQWAKRITGGDDDLIFQGDTNIKVGKQSAAFGWATEYGAVLPLADNKANSTSLSKKTIGAYSQPYDKIVHKSNMNFENAKIYKLYDFVTDPSIFQYAKISSYEQWAAYHNQHSTKARSKEYNYVYDGVSDHSPISYDLILDPNDEH